MSEISDLRTTVRVTVHLGSVERELLTALRLRQEHAIAMATQAARDFDTAAASLAAARGLRTAAVLDLTPAGLVVSILVGTPSDSPETP